MEGILQLRSAPTVPKMALFSLSNTQRTLLFTQFVSPTKSIFPVSLSLSAPRYPSFVQFASPDDQSSTAVTTETNEWALQDFYTLRKDVENAAVRVEEVRVSAGMKQLEEEVVALESKAADSTLWDDRAKAQETLQGLTDVKDKLKTLAEFQSQVEDAQTIVSLTEEMDSVDSGLLQEAANIIKELNKALDLFELTQLLSNPYDEGAVVSISAGASGTDAQEQLINTNQRSCCHILSNQKDNVANQREHLILLLVNLHIRQYPNPDQRLKLDDNALKEVMKRLFKNYKKWCKYLGRKSSLWLPAIQQEVQQRQLLYMGLYLIIRGEAANLRFMPECIRYIFHHMADELHGMLDENVSPITGERRKSA